MSNLVYLALFGIFVAIIVAIRVTGDRRAVMALVVYVLAVHGALAVTRRDAWPFVTHGVFLESGNEYRPLSSPRFVGVDPLGAEHAIDPRLWSPIGNRTLGIWWLMNSQRLTSQEQQDALSFLLGKTRSSPRSEFLRSPNWYSVDIPPPPLKTPLIALRVLLVTRVPAQKLADGSESARLLAQFPR